jgi:hypothetical protein
MSLVAKTMDGLTEYETRGLLMFAEITNTGALFGDPEQIQIVGITHFRTSDTFKLQLLVPNDGTIAGLFDQELHGIRTVGLGRGDPQYSMLDPQKGRVNSARTELPRLSEFATVTEVS